MALLLRREVWRYINSNLWKKIFFQAPPATDPVVQWSDSVMAERHQHLTEPECNTPVRQNRLGIEPGPPETFPAQRGSWAKFLNFNNELTQEPMADSLFFFLLYLLIILLLSFLLRQSTPDNSNLQGEVDKSSSCREFVLTGIDWIYIKIIVLSSLSLLPLLLISL